MENNKINEYLKKHEKVTVPMIQKALSLPYPIVRSAVAEYVENGGLEPEDGVTYRVCIAKPAEDETERADYGDSPALSEFARLRRRLSGYRGNRKEEPERDWDELAKKALWLCIKKRNVTTGAIMTEFSLEPSEAQELVSKMVNLGYILNTYLKIPKITEREYIERFGNPDEEDDGDDDYDGDDDDEEETAETNPFSMNGFLETVKIRTALSKVMGESVRRINEGVGQTRLTVGGKTFSVKLADEIFRISCGAELPACGDREIAEKIVGEYEYLKLEGDEITATVENQSETVGVLFDMYAAAERVSRIS